MHSILTASLAIIPLVAPIDDPPGGEDPGDLIFDCECLTQVVILWEEGYSGGVPAPLFDTPCTDYNLTPGQPLGCEVIQPGICSTVPIVAFFDPQNNPGSTTVGLEAPCGDRDDQVLESGGVNIGTIIMGCSNCTIIFGT